MARADRQTSVQLPAMPNKANCAKAKQNQQLVEVGQGKFG